MNRENEIGKWAATLHDAWLSGSPKPVMSLPDVTEQQAYAVQGQFAKLRNVGISGFKSGLSNKAAQASMGAEAPMGGILFMDSALPKNPVLLMSDFTTPIIETEIGFVIAEDIDHPLSVDEFIAHLDYWMPMVEIGDVGFAARPGLTDLIAGNVAAARYLPSEYRHPVDSVNEVQVTLARDGEQLHLGTARDALGDQLLAAKWLVDHFLDRGMPVCKGHILMTGSLGQVQAAKPGKYTADYSSAVSGTLGSLTFEFNQELT